MQSQPINYASIGSRLLAHLIDTVIFMMMLSPIFIFIFREEKTISAADIALLNEAQNNLEELKVLIDLPIMKPLIAEIIVVMVITILFWIKFSGTPGKLLLKIRVVDAKTGANLSPLQALVRYLGYFISAQLMFLGFIWIMLDSKNQGWHDKLANTIVINDPPAKSNVADRLEKTTKYDSFEA